MKTDRPLFRRLGVAFLTVCGLAGVSVADATWARAGWVFLAVLVAAAVRQATASKPDWLGTPWQTVRTSPGNGSSQFQLTRPARR